MVAAAEEEMARVQIADAAAIYVGQAAVDALREDARQQLADALADAGGMWEAVDLLNLDALKILRSRVDAAGRALEALVQLAPVPDVEG